MYVSLTIYKLKYEMFFSIYHSQSIITTRKPPPIHYYTILGPVQLSNRERKFIKHSTQ